MMLQRFPTLTGLSIRLFQAVAQLFIYSYLLFLGSYFVLRLLFWDELWIVALISVLIPWILFPLFLLPLISGFILQQKRLTIASSIVCLILIGWLHSNYWSPKPASIQDDSLTVKVLSLNLSWHSTKTETLVELLQSETPDLVLLQEPTHRNTHKVVPYVEELYPYTFFGNRVGMFSRYPIVDKKMIHLAELEEFQQRAIVDIEGQPVVVYNVQTTAPWIRPQPWIGNLTIPTYEDGDRNLQIADLIDRINKETLPVIAAGDFNLTDTSQDYRRLQSIMEDAYKQSGFGFGFTWPHGWPLSDLIKSINWTLTHPLFRIDQIWYSSEWSATSSQVLPPTGSEHLPVEASVALQLD
ncbi:MAG: endonuclease/exonuclease/phosphatase family protein [Chroococcales cyanobacterium]